MVDNLNKSIMNWRPMNEMYGLFWNVLLQCFHNKISIHLFVTLFLRRPMNEMYICRESSETSFCNAFMTQQIRYICLSRFLFGARQMKCRWSSETFCYKGSIKQILVTTSGRKRMTVITSWNFTEFRNPGALPWPCFFWAFALALALVWPWPWP